MEQVRATEDRRIVGKNGMEEALDKKDEDKDEDSKLATAECSVAVQEVVVTDGFH